MGRGRSVGCTWTAHVAARNGDRWRWHALKAVVDVFVVLCRLVDGQEAGRASDPIVRRALKQRSALWRSRIILVAGPIGARLVEHVMRMVHGLWRSVSIAQKLRRVRRLVIIIRRVPGGCRGRGRVGQVRAAAVVLLVHRERVVVVRHHSSITTQASLLFYLVAHFSSLHRRHKLSLTRITLLFYCSYLCFN